MRDLLIIGGGAGGLVVASVAARLGLAVTLIERHARLGGDCLHSGCVPSKSLIHAARIAHWMRRAGEFGLPVVTPAVDMARVSAYVQSVIARIQRHDDPARFEGYGCEVLYGEAHFVDAHTVRVGDRDLRARRIVIATGSRPFVPPIDGLAQAGYLTNEDLFTLDALPARLLVLGGGPVGLEMAQAFARLGSRVTLIERLPRLLPQEDAEFADALRAQLEGEGIEILTGTAVERVERAGGMRVVHLAGGQRREGDQLLVAVGRRPNVEMLNLAAAGIEHTAQGITVDRRQRTSQRHIHACGDVCGPYPFTHMAEYQAGIVIANTVFRWPQRADYRVVPRVIYTDPELARVGLTEQEARERHGQVEVLRFPFADVDRALCEDEPQGFMQLVTRRGRILGAGILGAQAGELIHEIALAMRAGLRVKDIATTIHAYPTRAQIHRRTANTAFAAQLFSPATRRLVRWLNRILP